MTSLYLPVPVIYSPIVPGVQNISRIHTSCPFSFGSGEGRYPLFTSQNLARFFFISSGASGAVKKLQYSHCGYPNRFSVAAFTFLRSKGSGLGIW